MRNAFLETVPDFEAFERQLFAFSKGTEPTSNNHTMNRRNPTRIELKLDDLQEYEALKKEHEEKSRPKDVAVNTEQAAGNSAPTKQSKQDRIGFRAYQSQT